MVQKDSANTSRPCTSLTIMHCPDRHAASLFDFSNPRAAKRVLLLLLAGWSLPIAILPHSISACEYKMVSRQVCPLVRQRK